jgi:putative FmdB family regulatory protein
MPTYEYRCEACGKHTETMQKISDKPLTQCPHCGKDALKRGPGGGIGVTFKGTGFYQTDYKSTPSKEENGGGGSCQKDSSGCCPCKK